MLSSVISTYTRKLRSIDTEYELVNFIWAMICCDIFLVGIIAWGV